MRLDYQKGVQNARYEVGAKSSIINMTINLRSGIISIWEKVKENTVQKVQYPLVA